MSVTVDLSIESPLWSAVGGLDRLAEEAVAAALAVSGAALPAMAEVSCLFCDDATIRGLNAQWRGIDKPTNVLSFPGGGPELPGAVKLLGDIVLAYETVEREAAAEDKPVSEHVSHLIVHGFLHLIGYDHEVSEEADAMEALESRAMLRLGRSDPYAGRPAADAP